VLALSGPTACTTEFPERAERVACATDDDCPDTDRCAEFTPGESRCWPEALVCGGTACPDGGDEPLLVPVGGSEAPFEHTAPPPEGGACPTDRRLTLCHVDNPGFCVYEPPSAELKLPCILLCGALSLDCEGTSINRGETCAITEYFGDCGIVGPDRGCVCTL
jgi:hypothetical protein